MPVAGVVPDMTADTRSYFTLQRAYKGWADEDACVLDAPGGQ